MTKIDKIDYENMYKCIMFCLDNENHAMYSCKHFTCVILLSNTKRNVQARDEGKYFALKG